MKGYRISCDAKDMQLSAVHAFISKTYWAKDIPIETMALAIKNSLCFGVFTETGEQVAFARMITDRATFAYLADVYVDQQHRSKGLSKWLMSAIMQHPDLQNIRRMVLATSDAHGLYEQFGFKALANANIFMEIHDANVYSKA